MEKRPIYDFGVEGPVHAEVFVLYLDGETVRLTGPCGPAAWFVEVHQQDDPLETVSRMVRSQVGEPILSHSTSWRRGRDAVVLSFVVVIEPSLADGMQSLPIARAELARNEATSAPASIETAQVLEHGLRHLAWLVRDDPVVAAELPDGWKRALAGYVPEPFRHLR